MSTSTIDLFKPRVMRAALEQLKPPRQFLRKTFFPNVETSDVELVDIDIVTESRRMAPFVSKRSPGKYVERAGFTTSTVSPPMLAPKMSLTIPDLEIRAPGEYLYSQRSPNDRAAEILRRDMQTLNDIIARREEWMCAQVLMNSSIQISGEDVTESLTIDFPRDSSLSLGTLSSTDRWDSATGDIPKQLRTWRRLVSQKSGVSLDIMVASPEAIDAMLSNKLLIGDATRGGQLNSLNMQLGQIKPEIRDEGAVFWGTFAGTNIQIWSYDEWYIDPADGVEKPMIPAKTVLLGSTQARTAMRYGGVGVKTSEQSIGIVADSRVVETWVEREPAVRWLKISSRPIPVPIQNNAFMTVQVLA